MTVRHYGLTERRLLGAHMAAADDRPWPSRRAMRNGIVGGIIGWCIIFGLLYAAWVAMP